MRKYTVDDSFFNEIETEAQAYFFGLLLADGTNYTEQGLVVIDLQEGDLQILQELNNLIQPDRPIPKYINNYSLTDRYRVSISSRKISDALLSKGMVQNKSYLLKEVNGIPEHLMNHFIRGYFDGNGSVGIYGKVRNSEFSIVSTKTFLHQIQQVLIRECGLGITKFGKRHKDREDEVYHIKYTGRNSCIKIREYLYKDATYFIERKRLRFDSIQDTKAKQLKAA